MSVNEKFGISSRRFSKEKSPSASLRDSWSENESAERRALRGRCGERGSLRDNKRTLLCDDVDRIYIVARTYGSTSFASFCAFSGPLRSPLSLLSVTRGLYKSGVL